MSNTDKNPSEEVDLGQIFNAIGGLFKNIYHAIFNLFYKFFKAVISILKLLIDNYKIVLPLVIISFLLGVYKESKTNPLYNSKMLVKTFFDSKFQLIDNIDYYNSLISNKNTEALQPIFEIEKEDLESIKSFDIEPGLETRNDLLKYYDLYIKEIDTSITSLISFNEFIKNRELVSGNLFGITVVSEKKDIFKNLEYGLRKSFANSHSIKVKQKRDSIFILQKESLLNQLDDLKKLKETYVNVLEQESKTPNLNLNYGQVPLNEQISKTKEFEIINKEIELKNRLRQLEQNQIEISEFYEILSSFQEVGSDYKPITINYKIVFPLISLLIFISLFLLWKAVIFIKNYD